jgi:hypothetical protein
MSLDKIQLPGFLLGPLFKRNLVLIKSGIVSDSPKKELKEISFLGGNKKKIVFIGNDDQNKFLGDNEMKFLNDLLNACNLTMADIAFLNFHGSVEFSYLDINERLHPDKILIFGVSAKGLDLPFEIPFFQAQNFQDRLYMFAPPLNNIQLDKELKKRLWACLQKIFNIQKKG